MEEIYEGDALVFIERNDDDFFSAVGGVRVTTTADGFLVGDADQPDITVTDLTTGQEVEIDEVEVVRIDFAEGGQQRSSTQVVALVEDGPVFGGDVLDSYAVRIEGDPLPTPFPGEELGDWVARIGADVTFLDETPGSRFEDGRTVDFDDVAGLGRVGGQAPQPLPEPMPDPGPAPGLVGDVSGTVYAARAIALEPQGDAEIITGTTTLRITAEADFFRTGDQDDVVEDVQILERRGPDEIEVEYVDVAEVEYSDGGQMQTARYVALFEDGGPDDDDDLSYLVLLSGDAFPDPAPGQTLDAFLAGLNASDRILSDIPGSVFFRGGAVDYARVAGVTERGPTLTVEEAQRIALLYEGGLDRDGNIDLPGLNFWIDRAEDGRTEEEIAQLFLDSPEFAGIFGDPDDLTDEELVELMYLNLLDRQSDPDGKQFWLEQLDKPQFSRADLLIFFAVSNENEADTPEVDSLVQTELGVWEFGLA